MSDVIMEPMTLHLSPQTTNILTEPAPQITDILTELYQSARIYRLEEYIRAHLALENLISNHSMSPASMAGKDQETEYNDRVERLRNAYARLPVDIFDEVLAEDNIVYADMIRWQEEDALRDREEALETDTRQGPT